MAKVIDVSEWQGKIDWKKVAASGTKGAIIRYADGSYLDPTFDRNMKQAKAAGLHIGAYIFSRAKTAAGARKEAKRLYKACKPYSPDMPLYIDLEARGLEKYADKVAIAFIGQMEKLGAKGGVYANCNWFSNYLNKTIKKYADRPLWIAQYYSRITHRDPSLFGMWQYTSKGSVDGIKGYVDRNKCYVAYWKDAKKTEAKPKATKKVPSLTLKKTRSEVIADAIKFGKWIASDNRFHYGHGKDAHHNGCYFCGTQPKSKKKSGIKEWETTYCCNPFVGACWAHGGGLPEALKLCSHGKSWDMGNGAGSYAKSKLFDNLGKIPVSKMQKGDVLTGYGNGHVMLYVGDGKVVHAGHEDDNKVDSKSWNSSITVTSSFSYEKVYRYNGDGFSCKRVISHGEVSDRVADLQRFLDWYFDGKVGEADGIFGDNTLKWTKKFQEKELGKGQGDGLVGEKTIAKMKELAE